MSRRIAAWLPALLTVASAASLFAADLPAPWRSWRYVRCVELPQLAERRAIVITLPWEIYRRSDSHGLDFRVINENGEEVPYLLPQASAGSRTSTFPSRIIERSFVPGKFTQVVVRMSDGGQRREGGYAIAERLNALPWFNSYSLSTSETDFMFWVETAVSDDAHEWRIVDARSPISRFRNRGLEGNQKVRFPGSSNQRFLRVRIMDAEKEFRVDNVEVLSAESSDSLRFPVPVTFAAVNSEDATESRFLCDLGNSNVPLEEINISTDQPEFYRAIRISSSDDNVQWSYQRGGEIYRFHSGDNLKESSGVAFLEVFARFWRVEIVNGNDQPLTNVRIAAKAAQRRIVFPAEPGHAYRLLYGNGKATRPHYDFGKILDGKEKEPIASLGPEAQNSNYADPRPFTERHPSLLWIVVTIAAALLAYTAFSVLRAPSPKPEQS
jgi:hypothetical protein